MDYTYLFMNVVYFTFIRTTKKVSYLSVLHMYMYYKHLGITHVYVYLGVIHVGVRQISVLVRCSYTCVISVCVAVCCSVLQCVAVCCSVLQCVAVC